jgi:hypothetical protein
MYCFCSGFVNALIDFGSLTTEIGQKMKLTERTGRPQLSRSLRGYAMIPMIFNIYLVLQSIDRDSTAVIQLGNPIAGMELSDPKLPVDKLPVDKLPMI